MGARDVVQRPERLLHTQDAGGSTPPVSTRIPTAALGRAGRLISVSQRPGWLSGDSTCLVSRRSNPPWVRVPHPAPQPRAVVERSKASVCKTDGASPRRFESAPHVHFPQGFKSLLLPKPRSQGDHDAERIRPELSGHFAAVPSVAPMTMAAVADRLRHRVVAPGRQVRLLSVAPNRP